jgi:hypothetical protein
MNKSLGQLDHGLDRVSAGLYVRLACHKSVRSSSVSQTGDNTVKPTVG